MAVPKRKTSKSRAGKRRSHIRVSSKNIIEDKKSDKEMIQLAKSELNELIEKNKNYEKILRIYLDGEILIAALEKTNFVIHWLFLILLFISPP